MRVEKFSGYEGLRPADLPKPAVLNGKVLLPVTAAGVTPLDHTLLSGHFPLAKPPLVLGNEGAGVVEEGGGRDFPIGSPVMFTGRCKLQRHVLRCSQLLRSDLRSPQLRFGGLLNLPALFVLTTF